MHRPIERKLYVIVQDVQNARRQRRSSAGLAVTRDSALSAGRLDMVKVQVHPQPQDDQHDTSPQAGQGEALRPG